VAPARTYSASVIGYWFPVDVEAAIARNGTRPVPVPDVGLFATLSRLRRPSVTEGFDRIYSVTIKPNDTFNVTETTPGA
jgi:hypothetical protein